MRSCLAKHLASPLLKSLCLLGATAPGYQACTRGRAQRALVLPFVSMQYGMRSISFLVAGNRNSPKNGALKNKQARFSPSIACQCIHFDSTVNRLWIAVPTPSTIAVCYLSPMLSPYTGRELWLLMTVLSSDMGRASTEPRTPPKYIACYLLPLSIYSSAQEVVT